MFFFLGLVPTSFVLFGDNSVIYNTLGLLFLFPAIGYSRNIVFIFCGWICLMVISFKNLISRDV